MSQCICLSCILLKSNKQKPKGLWPSQEWEIYMKKLLLSLTGLITLSALAVQFEMRGPDCKITIVGGGPSGVYTAMRLGEKHGKDVCLFEKEKKLGGRLNDIRKNPESKKGPLIAIGGRRVMTSQKLMFDLASEVGVKLEKPTEKAGEFLFARGLYSSKKDDFKIRYPGLPVNLEKGNFETQLLMKLFKSPERKNIKTYPNLRSYIESVVGTVGFNYLKDMSRFRGDFTYPLSAESYLDWLEEEFDVCCTAYYAVGGMTSFVKGMEKKAKSFGVQFFMSEPVYSINRNFVSGYNLVTSKKSFDTEKVIIAVPPVALPKIKGDVIDSIIKQSEFKSLIGIKVATVTQWFNKAWWKGIKRLSDNKTIWRAVTTDSCINSIEIPQEPYLINANAIRTVYSDRRECAEHFAFLSKTNPKRLEKEVHDGLKHLFEENGITIPVKVSHPTKTVFKEWEAGWYWIKAGSKHTNKEVSTWAANPLPGESVGLASEGYNPQRTAWTDGAIQAAIYLLNKQYKMNISL